MKQTVLHSQHLSLHAKMVDFSGYSMPLQYQSQMQEHLAVRNNAGIFDVSHMKVISITGNDTIKFIRYLVANDIAKLSPGKAMYTCMLNHKGGIIDDLIIYYFNNRHINLIVNAACADKDIKWMTTTAESFDVTINIQDTKSILAVQGPNAISLASKILPEEYSHVLSTLKPFETSLYNTDFIARTGYTGEYGFEIVVQPATAIQIWEQAIHEGITPCGLAARDTLRVEAGLNLYGQDMDETTSPLISNLKWTVSLDDTDRDFIGKQAILKEIECGVKFKLTGVSMTTPGMLRNHQQITFQDGTTGTITSGSFSPILKHAVGMARVPIKAPEYGQVMQRKQSTEIKLSPLPFIKKIKTVAI